MREQSRVVFITRNIPEAGMRLLRSFDVRINSHDRQLNRRELFAGVKGADAVITQLVDKVDADFFAVNPNLKIVSNYAVGYDNIDIPLATKLGIPVTNTPGVLVETVADYAVALILTCARRIVEADRYIVSGKYKGWDPGLMIGMELKGKTVAIIGMGRIGFQTAKRLKNGFDMKIVYVDERINEEAERELGARRMPLDEALRTADIVSLHVPLLTSSRHLIGAKQLAMMKPTAILINTARGAVVDEEALAKALLKKKLFAAGIDVFEHESKIHPLLKRLPNAVVTPHIASATKEAREEMARLACQAVVDVFRGRQPDNIVNPEAWEKKRKGGGRL
ncbi:MAG: D-glycerate dehydrogenase [bacterium]